MLYYLIYCSTALELMTEGALKVLLQQARRNNRELVITGLLVYAQGRAGSSEPARFMQVLEGSRFLVESVFEKIRQDRRHRDIIVIQRAAIQKRNFKTWDMGFTRVEELPAADAALDFLMGFYAESHSG